MGGLNLGTSFQGWMLDHYAAEVWEQPHPWKATLQGLPWAVPPQRMPGQPMGRVSRPVRDSGRQVAGLGQPPRRWTQLSRQKPHRSEEAGPAAGRGVWKEGLAHRAQRLAVGRGQLPHPALLLSRREGRGGPGVEASRLRELVGLPSRHEAVLCFLVVII